MKKPSPGVVLIGICLLLAVQLPAFAQAVYETQEDIDAQTRLNQAGQFRLGNVMGKTVVNQQGQSLGIIEDIIATQGGRIQYLILSADTGLGMTERLVPVPWQAADVRVQRDRLTLNLTRDQLDSAPSFTRGNLQDLSRPQVQQRINSYYETERFGDRDVYRDDEYRYEEGRYPEREGGSYEPKQEEIGTFGEYESHRVDGDVERKDEDIDRSDEGYPTRSRTYDDFDDEGDEDFDRDNIRDNGRSYD